MFSSYAKEADKRGIAVITNPSGDVYVLCRVKAGEPVVEISDGNYYIKTEKVVNDGR